MYIYVSLKALPPDSWHGKHTYLDWECWVQLNSILPADNIKLNNVNMERANTVQRMTNNHNNNERKQV